MGCAPTGEPFGLEAWERIEPSADPFPEHQPADLTCIGFARESGLLEVDTEICGYLNVGQVTQRKLRKGERLVGGMSHDDLYAEEDAATHAALVLGGDVIWEVDIPIPSAPMFHELDVALDAPVPAGTELVFHIHNHGVNNYRLLPVETR